MLGLEDELCPNVTASNNQAIAAERIVSLILIRLVALAAPSHQYQNLSTTCVCQTILRSHSMSCWPDTITNLVIQQLQKFVTKILSGYRRVPYHNFEHAYQVIISSNKLLDLILQSQSTASLKTSSTKLRFDEDPLMHLALLFAALIHDVDHQGVPNQQLVIENDPLALQYNDRSVAEQQSLSIAFTELLKANYDDLRNIMFQFTFSGDGYRRFRGAVANLVLATDITSPEQGEIVKKKWAAAFSGKTSNQAPKTAAKKMRKKTSSTQAIQPPKDHPSYPRPNRERKSVAEKREEQKSLERKLTIDSWVELGATPSTQFPSDTATTTTDSMHLWWFCATQEGDHEGEKTPTPGDSSSEGVTFHDEQPGDSGSYEGSLDASLTLLPESSANEDNSSEAVFQDIYPHVSQTFDGSSCTLEHEESQHLLSPKKVHRLNRMVSRSSSMLSPKSRRTKLAYCDMTKISIDEEPSLAKPKGLLSPFKKKKKKKDENSPKKDSETSPTSKDLPRAKVLIELKSMLNSLRSVDLMASVATLDLTTTENASSFASSSALRFDPQDRVATIERMVSEDETSCITHNTEPEPDVELCTSALLEHILLVADVAHNMQGWRLMLRWSDRLSQEMQKAIAEGRGGGMVTDPLEEWNDNQIKFLQGYVLPLAERLEKTGFVPRLVESEGPLLSSHIQSNCKRWRKQGDIIVSAWKDRREKQKNCIVAKRKQKGDALKMQSAGKEIGVLKRLQKENGCSNMQEVDCCPSRGGL